MHGIQTVQPYWQRTVSLSKGFATGLFRDENFDVNLVTTNSMVLSAIWDYNVTARVNGY